MRLLLIEDDDLLGDGLRDYLCADGHTVDWARRLADVDRLDHLPYDAWLVDWQLPDGSGLDWVRRQRTRGRATPVLMLTARDRLADRIEGLDSGADDYLVKPFAPEELIARLRAVSRRHAGVASSRLRVGSADVDIGARSVVVDGVHVDLTRREWMLLEALAQRAGRIVGRADLERLVLGGDAEATSNALEVHVSSLRRKLGRDVVETVRGLGYRMVVS